MPKQKPALKKAKAKPPSRRKVSPKKQAAPTRSINQGELSEDYLEYLGRYELLGKGRPRLSAAEFDRLDDELLDLIALDMERGLDDDQYIRAKELEFLMIHTEQ